MIRVQKLLSRSRGSLTELAVRPRGRGFQSVLKRLGTRSALRALIGKATKIAGKKMSLERDRNDLADPVYWANVAQLLIAVLVALRVVKSDEVEFGKSWVKRFAEAL